MITQSYPASDSIEFAANTKKGIDLPKSGYITQLDLLLTLEVDTGLTVSANQDPISRLIKGITVSASGGQKFLDLTDGRQLYWLDYLKLEGQLHGDTLTTTASQSDVSHEQELIIHWGFDWLNEFDPTVPIPTPRLDNPRIDVTWGAASDLGTGYTIDTSNTKIDVTVHELALDPGETEAERWPDGMISPRIEARTKTIDEIASNLGFERDVPVGDILYETLVMVLNSSGNRSDSEITRVGVKFPKQRRTPYERTWASMMAQTRRKYRIPSSLVGVTLLPWEELTRRAVGIDLKMAQSGDVQLAFTTAVENGTLHLVYFMNG